MEHVLVAPLTWWILFMELAVPFFNLLSAESRAVFQVIELWRAEFAAIWAHTAATQSDRCVPCALNKRDLSGLSQSCALVPILRAADSRRLDRTQVGLRWRHLLYHGQAIEWAQQAATKTPEIALGSALGRIYVFDCSIGIAAGLGSVNKHCLLQQSTSPSHNRSYCLTH